MEERVDVVSSDDVKMGVDTRKKVHASGAWHHGVHILVFDSRGRLLLQRRSAKKKTSPLAIDLSVSEHAREGESFEEAAVRGLREELGIGAIPLTRVLKFRMNYGPGDNMISVLFRGRFDGEVELDPAEVKEVIAVGSGRLRRLAEGGEEKVAPWARELLRWYLGMPSKAEEAREGRRTIKGVLFDYGGTLFKSARSWEEVRSEGFAAVHAVLKRGGLRMDPEAFEEFCEATFEEYAEMEAQEDRDIGDRVKYRDIVDELFPDAPEATRGRLASRANRAFWEVATKTYPLRKSAKRTLRELRARGLRMGVVSNHHDHESLVRHLRESGIVSHFEVVLASEREGIRKPNTAIFARSLESMGLRKEEAIFVGDSPRHDILGARASGISTVLIDDGEPLDSWKAHVGDPSEAKPDFVISDLWELTEVVDSLGVGRRRSGHRGGSRRRRRPTQMGTGEAKVQ